MDTSAGFRSANINAKLSVVNYKCCLRRINGGYLIHFSLIFIIEFSHGF